MPWATPLHTSGPPESPYGLREQGLSSPSADLFSLPPWGEWSLLGALADKRILLVLRFQSGPDNPPPPTRSLCPYVTLRQYPSPRDLRQTPDRRTGWGHRKELAPVAPIQRARLCMNDTGELTLKELLLSLRSPAHIWVVVL